MTTLSQLKEAVDYDSYAEYCASRREVGLSVIPQNLFNELKREKKMFERFAADLAYFANQEENQFSDGTINWDFVDSDMYMKWSVMVNGEQYTAWFDEAADQFEGV